MKFIAVSASRMQHSIQKDGQIYDCWIT